MTYQEVTITDAGRRAIINATGTNPVKITRAALGSEQYTPDPSQTRLRSVAPKYLSSLSGEVVNGDTIHLTITDASDDAYRVAELGLFTEDDILLAVYSQPDGAFMEKAAGSTLLLSVDIALHSLSTTSISFGDTRFSNPPASETVKGVVLLASPEDVESGTDTTKAVTPSGLKKALDAKAFALATALKPADILDASEAHKGLVELATTAEAMAGTDATRAVTPAGLRRAVDDKAATVKADLEQAFADADAALKAQIEGTITQTAKNIRDQVGAASHVLLQNAFIKADPDSVVFTRTAEDAISLKAGTAVDVHGKAISFTTDTAVVMPTLTPGTDYAVYVCADGSVRADANFKVPSGYTAANSRKIGGFHYAPGGNATVTQTGGDTRPAINPYAMWDLKFRPACKDPRGMTLVADSFWADIYLLGVNHNTDGTSKYGVTIADGASPPKHPAQFAGDVSLTYSSLNWWEAAEVMQAHGKQLPSYAEFSALAYGTTENESMGSDPRTTGLQAKYTSKWGVVQATGCMWVWGREFGGPHSSATWSANTGSRGRTYKLPNAVLLGGYWSDPSFVGSRCSTWDYPPSLSSGTTSARGVCAHRVLV